MGALIAIVGRPNVGKSALFNRIVGRRIAIVHDQPGVTRDRITVEAEWLGVPFTLVDTGGIGLMRGEKSEDLIIKAAIDQVELAIEAADVIILVVNVQEGLSALDQEVAARLRRSGKTILVAVNKVDNNKVENAAVEFSQLGFPQLFPVSAIHGMGIDDLMEAALKALPEEFRKVAEVTEGEKKEGFKLAILGRPNVGKSSIINALTKSERVIVSPIPGTTRDSVDVPFTVNTDGVKEQYILIDTAGVRQERRVNDSIEFFSIKRTEESIERADMVIFVLDAETGVSAHDKKVAGKILDAKKACLLVVNKWDLVQETLKQAVDEEREKKQQRGDKKKAITLAEFAGWVQENMYFLDYAPVIFTSAKSGFHLDRLLEAVRFVRAQLLQKIPTGLLNRTLQDAIEQRQPPSAAGHRLKFFYATQVKSAPPTFLLFVNKTDLFSPEYKKYLERHLRKAFGYEGCPIQLVPKARPKTIESIRKFKTAARNNARPEGRSMDRSKRNKKR